MHARTFSHATGCNWRNVRATSTRPTRHPTRLFAQDDDFVTRMVGKIFGEKVINDRKPFGLDRVDWSKIPDQFVTVDRDAAPVATDDAEMKLIRPLLAGTQLESENLRCEKASRPAAVWAQRADASCG
jgi:hypothetical protein